MQINGLQPQDIYKSYQKNTPRPSAPEKSGDSAPIADRVEISSQGSDITQAKELVKKSGIASGDSSGRSEKIEELKKQVQGGTYNVPSKDIAQSIIKGGNFDRKA